MPNHNDGSVISSYFTTGNSRTGKDVANEGLKFAEGQVEKIHFIDDQSNVSKKFVEYDVSVRDAYGGQSVFRNVRTMSSIFGFNDNDETVLEPNAFAFSGKLDPSNFFANKNGAIVVVAFLDGSKDKPVIIGALPHPKKPGAKRADGIRKKGEFRGVAWEVNKDGEFILTYNSNRSPNGKQVRADTAPTQIKIDKRGVFTITDNKNQKFEINRVIKTISFSNGTTVTYDGPNDKITMVTTKGTKIEILGKDTDAVNVVTAKGTKANIEGPADKVSLITAAGAKATIDGPADKIKLTTAGGANAEIDGAGNSVKLKDNGSGEVHIANDKIAIGASSAELLQQISDSLDKIITWANTVGAIHTHIGNLGYPTLVPDQASGYTQLGSDLSTIKGKVDGIKGTL